MKTGVTQKDFIAEHAGLLQMAREGVTDLELADGGEQVQIVYRNGYRKTVDIACDSGMAIIRDVAKQAG